MTELQRCPNCDEPLGKGVTRCWAPECDFVVPEGVEVIGDETTVTGEGESESANNFESTLSKKFEWIVLEGKDGTHSAYSSEDRFKSLKEEILSGKLRRDAKALYLPTVPGNNDTARKSAEWGELHEAARKVHKLDLLYRPVWASVLRGALIGTVLGIVLKYLDTTVTMFAAGEHIGLIWILVTGCLIASGKFPALFWAPVILSFVAMRSGININITFFFGAMLSTSLVGVLFGLPSGMVMGTFAGYLRKTASEHAQDADSEFPRALVWGLVVPLVAVAAWVWTYFFYIMPWIIRILESTT